MLRRLAHRLRIFRPPEPRADYAVVAQSPDTTSPRTAPRVGSANSLVSMNSLAESASPVTSPRGLRATFRIRATLARGAYAQAESKTPDSPPTPPPDERRPRPKLRIRAPTARHEKSLFDESPRDRPPKVRSFSSLASMGSPAVSPVVVSNAMRRVVSDDRLAEKSLSLLHPHHLMRRVPHSQGSLAELSKSPIIVEPSEEVRVRDLGSVDGEEACPSPPRLSSRFKLEAHLKFLLEVSEAGLIKKRQDYFLAQDENKALKDYFDAFKFALNRAYAASFVIDGGVKAKQSLSGEAGVDIVMSSTAGAIEKLTEGVPGLNIGGTIISSIVKTGLRTRSSNRRTKLFDMASSISEMEEIADKLARQIVFTIGDSIRRPQVLEDYDPGTFKKSKVLMTSILNKISTPLKREFFNSPQKKHALQDATMMLSSVLNGEVRFAGPLRLTDKSATLYDVVHRNRGSVYLLTDA